MAVVKVNSIRYNFLMNLLLTGSSVLFPLITFPFVSRALLSDGYGLVTWASSIASWVSLIAMLGVSRYGIREVARVRDDNEKLIRVTTEIFAIIIISTIIVLACFIISIFMLDQFSNCRELLLINAVTVLCNTLGVNWFFQGIEKYRYISIQGILIKIACFVGVVCFIHVPSDYMLYAGITVGAFSLANFANFLYMVYLINKAAKEVIEEKNNNPSNLKVIKQDNFIITRLKKSAFSGDGLRLKHHLKPLFTFFFVAASISVYTALDTVMLGFLSDNSQVGYYSAATGVKTALVGVVSALSGVLLPRASYMLCKGESDKFKSIVKKCILFVILVSIPLVLVLFVFGTQLIVLYAGSDFKAAGPIVSLIGLAVIPISLSVIFCDAVMVPLGMEKYCSIIYATAAVVDFVGNLFLIPLWGAMGATIATVFVETMIAVIEFFLIRKHIF